MTVIMRNGPRRNSHALVGVAFGAAILGASPLADAQVSWQTVVQYVKMILTEGTHWKLVATQTRISADRQVETQQKANQQLAGAFDLIRKQERLTDAVRDHGAATGQPESIGCAALEHADLALRARQQAELDSGKLMQSFADSRQHSATQARDNIMKKLKDEYCTVSEARQGICELRGNGMQGWNRNSAGAFSFETMSPEAENAAYDYAELVSSPARDEVIECEGAACDQNQLTSLGQKAVASLIADTYVEQAASRRSPVLTGK